MFCHTRQTVVKCEKAPRKGKHNRKTHKLTNRQYTSDEMHELISASERKRGRKPLARLKWHKVLHSIEHWSHRAGTLNKSISCTSRRFDSFGYARCFFAFVCGNGYFLLLQLHQTGNSKREVSSVCFICYFFPSAHFNFACYNRVKLRKTVHSYQVTPCLDDIYIFHPPCKDDGSR